MKIIFKKEIYDEWSYYVNKARGEISAFGRVEFKDGNAYIIGLTLPKQTNTGTSTEFDSIALSDILVKALQAGIPPESYVVWLHSHAQMATFWSQTDVTNIKRWGISGQHLVSVVSNHKGEHLGRCDIFSPYFLSTECPVEVESSVNFDPAWEQNFIDNCERKVTYTVEPFQYEPGWTYDERVRGFQGELFPEAIKKREETEEDAEEEDWREQLQDFLGQLEGAFSELRTGYLRARDTENERDGHLYRTAVAGIKEAEKEVTRIYGEILEFCRFIAF